MSVIFGMHAVRARLQREQVEEGTTLAFVSNRRDRRLQEVLKLARQQKVEALPVDKARMLALTGTEKHQGVALLGASESTLPEYNENDLWSLIEKSSNPLLLVLDQVTDPHNLGACLRSSDAAGVVAVIVPKDNAVGLTPTAIKVASGAAETVPFIAVTNLSRTLQEMQRQGVWTVGLAGEAEQTLYQVDLTGPIALVLGSEGEGMRRLTKERCDYLAKLPMQGSVSSLNVSVTAGISLFEAIRQRSLI